MLEKLLSLTGIKPTSLKTTEFTGTEKALPQNNSIVKLDILEKLGGNYKLLIDGRLFQSKLPVDAQLGDFLLAKVISQNPFTLALDGFFNIQNLTAKDLSFLLAKLQIKDSELSEKVIKGFINNKKPLEKSKIEKLIKLLESEDISMDDIQLGYLIQVFCSDSETYPGLNESAVQLFSFPIGNIINDIYDSIKSLNTSGLSKQLLSTLNESFIVNSEDLEKIDGLKLKNYNNQLNGFFNFIDQIDQLDESSTLASQQINKFKTAFIRYNLQKAYLSGMGVSPEFIIIKEGEKLELFEYEVKKTISEKNGETHHIRLEMCPDQLGLVSIGGYFSQNTFQATISASEKTCTVFAYDKEKLADKLQNELNIKTKLSFEAQNPVKNDPGSNPQSNTGFIDVKL